jgi:glycosyltransferase involved in cell wall biosynthesis
MPPRVSVIIPCYNRSVELSRAITSVLAQDMADFEVIVGDDGSTEDLHAVIAATHDDRVRICRSDVNRGIGAGRNVAVASATAPFLAFLDSDDEWRPRHLSVLIDALSRTPAPVVAASSPFVMAYADGRREVRRPRPEPDIVRRIVRGADLAAGSTMMIHTGSWHRVGPWCTAIRRAEDYEWFLRFGYEHMVTEEVTAVIHADDSVPLDAAALRFGMREVLLRHADALRQRDPALLRALRAKFHEELAWAAWRNDRHVACAGHIAAAVLLDPPTRLGKLARSARSRLAYRATWAAPLAAER